MLTIVAKHPRVFSFYFFLFFFIYVCMCGCISPANKIRSKTLKKHKKTEDDNSIYTKRKKKGLTCISYFFIYLFFLPIFENIYPKMSSLPTNGLILINEKILSLYKAHTHTRWLVV